MEKSSKNTLDKSQEIVPNEDGVYPKPDRIFGIRHLQCFMLFLMLTVAYSMRVNMSVAIVPMSNSSNANTDFPDYGWSSSTQSTVLSSFFWGYVVTQVPAGLLGQKYGPKLFLMIAVAITSVFNILTPLAAQLGDWQLVCASRVLQGLSQAFCFPSTHNLLSKWSPVSERGSLSTYVYAGCQVGTVLALPICGYLAKSDAGWPSVFYLFGGLGLLWCVAWFFLAADSPETHKLITDEEKKYIVSSIATVTSNNKSARTPWISIFTSLPMWAVILAHCGQNWGFWTLLTEIPTYMNYVLKFSISENGLLSALPYLVMWLTSFVFGFVADLLEKRNITSIAVSRKIFNTIAHWIPALAMIGLAYVPVDDPTFAVTLLTIAVGVNSATYVGFQLNHIDLSPNYAGTMMGITNCAANIMSIIGPLMVGVIVSDQEDETQWRIVFFIASGVYFACNLFFIIFGQGVVQPWNDPDYRKKRKDDVELENVEASDSSETKK